MESGFQEEQWRMPAEWERHEATWLSWPNFGQEDFRFHLEQIMNDLLELIVDLIDGERVYLNVSLPEEEVWIRRRLGRAELEQVRFFPIPTNEPWCRDHGPGFVVGKGAKERNSLGAVCWRFNGWGEVYPSWRLDAEAGRLMSQAIHAKVLPSDWVLEGGAIEVDGGGTALTTESVLWASGRNPGRSRAELEAEWRSWLSVDQVVYLKSGLVGDDTQGHVDTLARFLPSGCVVAHPEVDGNHPDHRACRENWEVLRTASRQLGRDLISLPAPPTLKSRGRILPAGYANFLVGNSVVIVPGLGTSEDDRARGILQEHFPDRRVVLRDARRVLMGYGAWHCLSCIVPSWNGS